MQALSRTGVRRLAERRERPVVTIYLPTETAGPATRQSPIRFKNLVNEAKKRLRDSPDGKGLLQSLSAGCDRRVGDDEFWHHQAEGLAVFCDEKSCELRPLPIRPPELVNVGRRFYIKPLLPLVARYEPYLLLALSGNRCELFRGDPGGLEKVSIEGLPKSLDDALRFDDPEKSLQLHTGASGSAAMFHGQGSSADDRKDRFLRYFQACDHALHPYLEREDLPLLLATVDEHAALFRRASRYAGLVGDAWVAGSPDDRSIDELHRGAQALVDSRLERSERDAVERLHGLVGADGATADLNQVATAIRQGRVQTAFVASDRTQSGSIDETSGAVDLDGDGETDVLNEIAAETLLLGGEARAVASETLPNQSSAAAIFRF